MLWSKVSDGQSAGAIIETGFGPTQRRGQTKANAECWRRNRNNRKYRAGKKVIRVLRGSDEASKGKAIQGGQREIEVKLRCLQFR